MEMRMRFLNQIVIIIGVLIVSSLGFSQDNDIDKKQNMKLNIIDVDTKKIVTIKSDLSKNKRIVIQHQLKKVSTDLLKLIDDDNLPQSMKREAHRATMKKMGQLKSIDTMSIPSELITEDVVYVYIYLKPDTDPKIVDPYAWKVTGIDKNNKFVVAWVTVGNLEPLASQEGVRTIRTVMPPIKRTGSVTTEGDAIHSSSDVRESFLLGGGAGIKVGIISDGVDNRDIAQMLLDLPADGNGLTVLRNNEGGDEGTAMLEIVHDLAPDAELFFHDAGADVLEFNSAIDALVSAGCNVICDDIGWITEPFFENGVVASHVADVIESNDIIFFSSAGNSASRHYQGDFVNAPAPNENFHDFSHGDDNDDGLNDLYIQLGPGQNVTVVLQWNDEFGSSGNDYDMFLYSDYLDAIVASSQIIQDGDDDPIEFFSVTPLTIPESGYKILVKQFDGIDKTLEVFIYDAPVVYTNNLIKEDSIFGHPSVPGVFAVGAIDAADADNDDIAFYSSLGPVTITYPSHEEIVKPDICGIAGVTVTGAGGFPSPFHGTSASAPHIAGIAAQVWAHFPDRSRDEIMHMILDSAIDLGDSGIDTIFGWGLADTWQIFDKYDECPDDPDKTEEGACGCGVPDIDGDGDGTPDCIDECPDDPDKTEIGVCGCGKPDVDEDGDGTVDCPIEIIHEPPPPPTPEGEGGGGGCFIMAI